MKTLQYLFFGALATLLMAADCSNKDSEFYNDVFISVPNLVHVESDYAISNGDPFIVGANFPKIVSEQGQDTDVDLFRTTGGARSFTFSYLIEKLNQNNEYEPVNIDDGNVVKDLGESVSYGDFVLAQAVFNDATQSYEYRGGVTMAPGYYRARFNYNNSPSTSLVLTSDSTANNLFVTIYSTCADTDNEGYFLFVVGN